jgi:hypothetical protein
MLANASDGPNADSTTKQLLPPSYAVAAASTDWVPTPAGLAYRSCVHQVPNGADVSASGEVMLNGVKIQKIPTCPYSGTVAVPVENDSTGGFAPTTVDPPDPLHSGWWLDSWWTSSKQVVSLTAKWTVPPAPTLNGATVFLFPSVEPSDSGGAIVQPVLQWGSSVAGGGNSWTIASWFVPGNGIALFSPLVYTAAGRTLTGTMTRGSSSASRWIISLDQTSGVDTMLSVDTNITSWKAVQGAVLEVYGASSCGRLPNTSSVKFSSITAKSSSGTLTPSFSDNRRVTSCNSKISHTNTTTTLGWKAS